MARSMNRQTVFAALGALAAGSVLGVVTFVRSSPSGAPDRRWRPSDP